MSFYPIADDGIGYHYAANAANINYNKDKWNIAHVQPGGFGIAMDTGRTMILFDFTTFPSQTKISKITLSMYAYPYQAGPTYNGHAGKDNQVVLQRITEQWKPSITTWNTKPKTTEDNQVILSKNKTKYQDYIDIDVTSLFLPMVTNPTINFGIQMKLLNEIPTNVMIFCSTNYADNSKHPKITIYYEDIKIDPNPNTGTNTNNNTNTNTNNNTNPTPSRDTVCESQERIFIPNSFSPNDDGVNDYFTVFTKEDLKINYLRIFDRWGEMVFENTNFKSNDDVNGWNGKFRNAPLPSATYAYDILITDQHRCTKLLKGDISLLK
jgi:gliding motility-associated-like protein